MKVFTSIVVGIIIGILLSWIFYLQTMEVIITPNVPTAKEIKVIEQVFIDSSKAERTRLETDNKRLSAKVIVYRSELEQSRNNEQILAGYLNSEQQPQKVVEYIELSSLNDSLCQVNIQALDSTIYVKDQMLVERDSLYARQKRLTDIAIDRGNAWEDQANKFKKESKSKKIGNGFLKAAIPVAAIGGIVLGTKLK